MSTSGAKEVLLVEDDLPLAGLISEYLGQNGYHVTQVHAGDEAVPVIVSSRPDLVILDLMLPGLDGLSVCREVRPLYPGPILMLTAREDDMDQVAGLEMGADDYVKKPVEPRVLLARIRALFRRYEGTAPTAGAKGDTRDLHFGALEIRMTTRSVSFCGEEVKLSTTEFDTLRVLASHAGDILSRDDLSRELKGREYDGIDRSIDICISRLRRKLEENPETPERIKTVWGSGYLFVTDAWEATNHG
ncbi:response regulator [Desulfoluna spongiiphila]|uniref:Two-component system, OmpR family, response regulator/two-component system, OmpR family, response regulator RstA/two-component system, OmpR family, response regulator ParR n=1 Tax=Desulfoluna spongiiphila TaxID=419481 RepID=A0A1G5AE51_9BACT|nr:response regulator [Desulfoluna spongiiphila]SCX76156.1 two-component system, OmpR family, response regulator/two-component system, OmpR family, response regulator RstA/two-component system, OmpR family, response regulator ParR [Desulfoluna spongiiphila]VVS90677.1 signal transduction response regulator receiver domain [Desulfoluna spongiiphila]